jgi:hypothetical protein
MVPIPADSFWKMRGKYACALLLIPGLPSPGEETGILFASYLEQVVRSRQTPSHLEMRGVFDAPFMMH